MRIYFYLRFKSKFHLRKKQQDLNCLFPTSHPEMTVLTCLKK